MQGAPRGSVVQHQMIPLPLMMGPPLPFSADPFGHDDIFDEEEEDPFEVIRHMEQQMQERRRNAGFFGGSAGTPTINVKPSMAPALAETLTEGQPHPEKATPHHEHHAYNDAASHSPLYMFMCVVMVAAVGFGLWYGFIKDAMSQGAAQKRREPEQREISLNRFNKNV